MKTKYILICSLLFFVTTAMAQPKPKPKKKPPSRESSVTAETIRGILNKLYKEGKLEGKTNPDCDPAVYINSNLYNKLIPRRWVLGRALDKFVAKNHFAFESHKAFGRSKSLKEFTELSWNKPFDKIDRLPKITSKEHYDELISFSKEGFPLYKNTFKVKKCAYTVDTRLILVSMGSHEKSIRTQSPRFTSLFWDLKSTINIKCDCKKPDKMNLKNGTIEYITRMHSEIMYGPDRFFQTIKSPNFKLKYKVLEADCCPTEEPKAEDGSFMDPDEDEDISFPNQFIEVGAGVATVKDEETELCASVGFMHNLLPGDENGLFIGGRASVHNASFSGSDFSQTTINVGPAVEYQTFIGDTSTKWINGINGSFVFGSENSGEFKTDISGINIGLYTGVEVPLGDQFALGVMASLISFNNLTFKTDEGEFKSNSTGLSLNKGSVGLSLRIALDNN